MYHGSFNATGVSINWTGVASKAWPLAAGSSGGSAEVTLAASGRKAGTNKSVSFAHREGAYSSLRAKNANTDGMSVTKTAC